MDPIRIGMINAHDDPRGNCHAYYYAGLMGGYDPLVYRDDPMGSGHTCYFYFYQKHNAPTQITVPTVDGFRIAKLWDRHREQAENQARIFAEHETVVADTPEEACEDVDLVFVPDSVGDGSDHLRLAEPALRKGLPTFVDKPFAAEYADAKRMIDLAHEHGAPIFTRSMLQVVPQSIHFKSRFAELGAPEFATMKGSYFHSICLAQFLFGLGVEGVEVMGPTPLAYIRLDYGEQADKPRDGVMIHCLSGGRPHCSMYASAYSAKGVIHSPAIGDFEFPWGAARILEQIKETVATRRSPLSDEAMLENVAVLTAARRSQEEKRRVAVAEIVEGA